MTSCTSVETSTVFLPATDTPPATPKTFYRKELPANCIDFASARGREIFKQAIGSKYMESYFAVSSQFHTQNEPAFCGFGTLVNVLNALNVDPGRVWKGPWRWFCEEMLDCCEDLEEIKKTGLTLAQVVCLANCNGLSTSMRYASESCVDEFRHFVRSSTQSTDHILVVSYNRSVLGQAGIGHFSPIGGYHEDLGLVLIMDVARFKYPPHWVPVSLLFQAMVSVDKACDLSRGFIDCS